MLDVTTVLLEHAAQAGRTRRSNFAFQLKEFRAEAVEGLKVLAQWAQALSEEKEVREAAAMASPALAASMAAGKGGGMGSSMASAVSSRDSMAMGPDEFLGRFEEKLSGALDAFKALLQGGTGEVGITVSMGIGDVLSAYTTLRTLFSVRARTKVGAEGFDAATRISTALRTPACNEVLRALQRALLTDNPGGEVRPGEAKRQLLFFCNSLHNHTMKVPPPVTFRTQWLRQSQTA